MMTTANSKELTPRQRGVPNHQSRSSKSSHSSESTSLPVFSTPATKSSHRHPSKTQSSYPSNSSMASDPGSKLLSKVSNELSTLKLLFTEWTEEDLLNALEDVGGDLDTAIGRIGEGKNEFVHFPYFPIPKWGVIFGVALVVMMCVPFFLYHFHVFPSSFTASSSSPLLFYFIILVLLIQLVACPYQTSTPFLIYFFPFNFLPFLLVPHIILGHAAQWAPVAKKEKKPVSFSKSVVNSLDSMGLNSSSPSPTFRSPKDGSRGGRGGGTVSRGGIRGGRGGSRGGYTGKNNGRKGTIPIHTSPFWKSSNLNLNSYHNFPTK